MEHSPSTSASSEDRQPTRNESIPLKRHKKEAMTSAEKTVVVLQSKNIQNKDGPVLMANTSKVVTLYNFEITSNMSQTDLTEKLTGLYPKLKGRRFYCASSTGKKAILDFDGNRRIWDGPFILRKIDGNRALYIVTDEVVTSTETGGHGISDTGWSSGDNPSQSDNVVEQQSPPLQQPLVKIHCNRGAIEENQGNKRRTSFKGAWHCNPAASFESQSSFPSAQNITATSTFPKGDAARHLMADGGAPSVSCVGQSSVSQGGQIQFSGECSSTQSTMPESENYQSTHEAVSALDGNNPDYQYDRMDAPNLCDLKGLNVFDMDKESPFDWKDVLDVLREDSTNSDQLVSHQSTTAEVTPQFPITTSDASGGETDQGYSSAEWHCNPAASFASQSSLPLAQNVTATSTFPKGDAARHLMADGCAPSVSCVGQSSVSQGVQMHFSGECTSTLSPMLESDDYQFIHEAVSAPGGDNPDYQCNPMDALNLCDSKGEFLFDWKDLQDVLQQDLTNSDQLVRHQSTTTEVTTQFSITTAEASGGETDRGYSSAGSSFQGQIVQEVAAFSIHGNRNSCEIPALAATASKRPATDNLVHEGSSFQGQIVQEVAACSIHDNRSSCKIPALAAKASEKPAADNLVHEGNSSQEQEVHFKAKLQVDPSCGPVKGGQAFFLKSDKPLPETAWARFGDSDPVGIGKTAIHQDKLFGTTPCGKPGAVPVKIFNINGVCLGEGTYTYEPEPKEKRKKQRVPSKKRKHEEMKDLIRKTIQDSLKQPRRGSTKEPNETMDSQQGPANQEIELQPADILKPLVYAGAQAGASELIKIIFNLPVAKIIFETYKNESCLPEDIAEENGHKEIARFLRGITKRYCKENGTSLGQPDVIDWLALSKALEEIEFDQSETSSDTDDSKQMCKDVLQTGYCDDYSEGESSLWKGLVNLEKPLEPGNILKNLVYAAAEAGLMTPIKTVFRSPTGRIVCEVCQEEDSLPEDVAEENGHEMVAAYLRGVTKRYLDERCTTSDQSSTVAFDWLELLSALEKRLTQTEPSSGNEFKQILEDDITETGYYASGEMSSSGSTKEISNFDDNLKIGAWKEEFCRQQTVAQGDCEKKESGKFQEQVSAKVQELTDLQREFTDREQDIVELQRDLSATKRKLSEYEFQAKTNGWVICPDELQLSDERLGVGSFGRVLKGSYRGCEVAIKKFHLPTVTGQQRRLFEREIEMASRCRHPCLLQFIGATQDESPLIVTEIMDTSLRALLHNQKKENQQLTKTEIIRISLDVAQALDYLHQRTPPIVHRDVSSANVLLWKQNTQWRGKLGDYGTTKFLQETMTVAPGAMLYAAPEVCCPFDQTVKIDVFSFGVLLLEMCTGELPDIENREDQVRLVTKKKFGLLILWCIEEDPQMRPSMEKIVEQLERLNAKS